VTTLAWFETAYFWHQYIILGSTCPVTILEWFETANFWQQFIILEGTCPVTILAWFEIAVLLAAIHHLGNEPVP
jgi:hypothetical protein